MTTRPTAVSRATNDQTDAARAAKSRSRKAAARKPLGSVAFVGAGPGDPGLLTVRASELLAQADVVILDLASQRELLSQCRADVIVLDGGFGEDGAPLARAQRAKMVLTEVRAGRRVVRLYSGDPFVYATGAEDAAACAKAGVEFEIVPGVSSLSAVPAYAGIPLTTKSNRTFQVVDMNGPVLWNQLSITGTLVVLCGVAEIEAVVEEIRGVGRSADTPVAITSAGSTTAQRTVVSTLDGIVHEASSAELAAPVVMVIGEVVDERDRLSWFESKPLFGWRVLVPRTKEQSAPLLAALRECGAVPEEVPTIAVEPPRTPQQMEKAIRGLVEGRYEWVAITSVNALRAVREKFEMYGLDARALSGLKVAAVGAATVAALRSWGIEPDLVPSGDQSVMGLVEDWPPYDDVLDPINRVLLPRADIATETLVASLVELGWEVDDVTAYRTVRAAPPAAEVRADIKAGAYDAVLFTSASTVRNLVGIAGKPHTTSVIAVIGPHTAKTAEENGLRVDVMAATPDASELVRALAAFAEARRDAALAAGEPVTRPSDRRPAARRKAT